VPEPSVYDVEMAIEKLKRHKSPGIDQIPVELINTFRPILVLVPSILSRQQSGLGTFTKLIFISLLKKKVLGVLASGLYH
jgi:hypothetical protein